MNSLYTRRERRLDDAIRATPLGRPPLFLLAGHETTTNALTWLPVASPFPYPHQQTIPAPLTAELSIHPIACTFLPSPEELRALKGRILWGDGEKRRRNAKGHEGDAGVGLA